MTTNRARIAFFSGLSRIHEIKEKFPEGGEGNFTRWFSEGMGHSLGFQRREGMETSLTKFISLR